MAIVKVEKNTYTADTLYQWDVNQTLEIRGLSLASIPEIHYTNAAMERALVRQATMDAAGVVRAEIPNGLLQKPYKVVAYVCVYEGSGFRSLYKVEIPMKERPQPSDYVLVDDPDVYSFTVLEAKIDRVLARDSNAEEKYEAAVALVESNAAELAAARTAYAEAVTRLENEAGAVAKETAEDALANMTAESLGAYTKEQILSPETRELYELDETAVPDDVLALVKTLIQSSDAAVKSMGDTVTGLAASVSTAAKVYTCTWTGTGTFGASNPRTISPGFKPLLVLAGSEPFNPRGQGLIAFKGSGDGYADSSFPELKVTMDWTDTSVSWYSTVTALAQYNGSGKSYVAIVIGV